MRKKSGEMEFDYRQVFLFLENYNSVTVHRKIYAILF